MDIPAYYSCYTYMNYYAGRANYASDASDASDGNKANNIYEGIILYCSDNKLRVLESSDLDDCSALSYSYKLLDLIIKNIYIIIIIN